MANWRTWLGVIAAACWLHATPSLAYETDQYTNRGEVVADSTAVMNREVNRTIADIAANWSKGHDEMAFVSAVYHRIGGHHWVDKLEKWAMKSSEVDKLSTPRYGSVYSGFPPWVMRVTALFGVGKSIRLNNQLIGSDKIGPFLSQGRKFYRRYARMGSEIEAAKQSIFTEKAIFGKLTTGSYSNADLVANYEGHRFYRSLFEDDVIPGKPAILRWEDNTWVVQREFDWGDHVTAYWDEVLLPNDFDCLAKAYVRKRIAGFCNAFWIEPDLYRIADDSALAARYRHIGVRDTRDMRVDVICTSEDIFLTEVASLGR
jgi:hypothetical protein